MDPRLENEALRDAIYALAMADNLPTAETLDELAKQFPDHANALTEFAIALTMDFIVNPDDGDFAPDFDPETVSPMVSRAISHFHNKLYELKNTSNATVSQRAIASVQNPFSILSRQQFRELASDMHMNVVLLTKIRDRIIDPTTIPKKLCRYIADKMQIPYTMIESHLSAPKAYSKAIQYYKATDKPKLSEVQSYPDAVKGAGLTKEQQTFLLGLKD